MSSDVAVRFDSVSKTYTVRDKAFPGIKHVLLHLPAYLRSRRNRRSFLALDEVSFEVRKGESFGIIGNNGSGKSTTLGLIAGVLRPSGGGIEIDARVSPLLQLGAGFHPELAGDENIILNGLLLGLTKREVSEKLEEIKAFSELGDFLLQPVRTYSSGMVARLGFSVIVHLAPELLLIDEVLAVGDAAFQKKCLAKMAQFRSEGVTMVFVSHAMASVQAVCDRVALLQAGRLVSVGPPAEVIAEYTRLVQSQTG